MPPRTAATVKKVAAKCAPAKGAGKAKPASASGPQGAALKRGKPSGLSPVTAAATALPFPRAEAQAKLHAWYGVAHRYFPWRTTIHPADADGCAGLPEVTGGDGHVGTLLPLRGKEARAAAQGSRVTPYAIWVSEIMSQQTQLSAVVPYWLRWLSLFPTPAALAAAEIDDVRAAWAGLGFYRRAAFLHKGAQHVVSAHGGQLPASSVDLLAVPGIGPYTAAAVASVCAREQVPVVDGNVIRVVSRLMGWRDVDAKTSSTAERVRAVASELIRGDANPGDFNQGLMELGATVCRPGGAPRCEECPFAALGCRARAMAAAGELGPDGAIEGVIPLTHKAAAKRHDAFIGIAVVRPRRGCGDVGTGTKEASAAAASDLEILLEKRPPGTGLLSGFWQVPLVALNATGSEAPQTAGVTAASIGKALAPAAKAFLAGAGAVKDATLLSGHGVRHIFSHIDHRTILAVKRLPTSTPGAAAVEAAVRATAETATSTAGGAAAAAGGAEFKWFPVAEVLQKHPPAAMSALTLKHVRQVAKHAPS